MTGDSGHRFYIKRLLWLDALYLVILLSLLVIFLFDIKAAAHSNSTLFTTPQNEAYFDLNKTTIYNTPGIPDEKAWEDYLEQQRLLEFQNKRSKAQNLPFDGCNCVSYVRWKTGINVGSITLAKYHPVNSQIPEVGAIIVTYESARGTNTGHLGEVAEIDWINRKVRINETNYIGCTVTTDRWLLMDSALIKGYYIKN